MQLEIDSFSNEGLDLDRGTRVSALKVLRDSPGHRGTQATVVAAIVDCVIGLA